MLLNSRPCLREASSVKLGYSGAQWQQSEAGNLTFAPFFCSYAHVVKDPTKVGNNDWQFDWSLFVHLKLDLGTVILRGGLKVWIRKKRILHNRECSLTDSLVDLLYGRTMEETYKFIGSVVPMMTMSHFRIKHQVLQTLLLQHSHIATLVSYEEHARLHISIC